jgi:L-threonylcarbamoyladenylate synthase
MRKPSTVRTHNLDWRAAPRRGDAAPRGGPTVDDALILYASRLLRAGGVIALPTETVYGLAADIANEAATRRVFAIKGRPLAHPLIVHIADAGDIDRYAVDAPPEARVLAKHFWPGPLTMVLRKSPLVPAYVTGGQDTVALRVVDQRTTRAIIRSFGGAVAAPSANRFGRVSPTSAAHVRDDLGDDVDFIVDGGPSLVGVESTIVDLTGRVPAILRAGAIGRAALASVLGRPVVRRRKPGSVRVSGTLASHYAPRASVVLRDARSADRELAKLLEDGVRAVRLVLPADPAEAARSLYASLRELDAAGYDAIVATLPPATEANAAVRDRLSRAAAPR